MIDKVGHYDIDFSEVMIVGPSREPYHQDFPSSAEYVVTFRSGVTEVFTKGEMDRETFIDKWKKAKGQYSV
jgi:hypothetical protein